MTTVEPPPGQSKTPTTSTAAGEWHPRTAADMLREKPEASSGNSRKKSCHAAVGDTNTGARSTSSSASGGHAATSAATTTLPGEAASRSPPASRNRAGASVQATTTAASPASTGSFSSDFTQRSHDRDSPKLPWRGGDDPGVPSSSSSRGGKDEAGHVRGWERRCWAARGGNEADPYQREVEKESRRWRERGGSGSAVEAGGEGGVAALLQSAGTRTTTASAVKTPTTPPTSPQPSTFNGTSNTSNGATGTFTTTNSTGSSTTNGGVERMRDDLPDARSAAGLLEPKDEAVHYHPRRRSSSSGSSSSNCRTMMSGTTRWPSTSTGAAIPGAGARAGGAADQGNEKEKEESEEAGGERAAGASAADDRSAAAGASHGAGRRGSSAAHADTAVSASGGPGGVLQRPKGGSAPRQESGGGRPTVQQKSDRWTALEVIIPRLEGGLSKDMCPAVPAEGSTPYDRVPIPRTGTSPTVPENPCPLMRPASRDPHQGPPCLQQNSSGAYGHEPGESSEEQQCHARSTGGGRRTSSERQPTCAGNNSVGGGTSGGVSLGGGRQARRFSDLADGETTPAETAVVISTDSSDGSVAGVSEGSSPVPVSGREEAAGGGGNSSGPGSGVVSVCVQAKSGSTEPGVAASDGNSADECTVVGGAERLGEGRAGRLGEREGGGRGLGGSKERGVFRAPPMYEHGLADSKGVQAPCERTSGDTTLRSVDDEDGRGGQDGGGDGGVSAAGGVVGAAVGAAGTSSVARDCALPSTGGGAVKAAAALAAVPLAAKAAAAVLDGLDGRAVTLDGRPIIPGVPAGAMMEKPGQAKTECLVEVSIGLGGEYVYSFNKSGAPRRGKWSRLEEEYAKRIINDFDDGVLDAPPGVGLRQLLASKLRCEVMRVSKKFCGWACVGKRSFRPVRHPDGRASRAQTSLYSLEQCWLKTFVPSSRCSSSPSNTLPPPFKASSYPSSNCTASKSLMRLVPAPPAVERDGGLASLKKQTTPAQTWLNRVRKALARDASVGAMDSLVKEGRMYCRDADVMTGDFSEVPSSTRSGDAEVVGGDGGPTDRTITPGSSHEGQCRLMKQMHNAVRDKYGRPDVAGSVSPSHSRRVLGGGGDGGGDRGGGGGGGGGGDEPLQWWVAPRRDEQTGGDDREEAWRQQQQHQQGQEQYQQQQQQHQPHTEYRHHEENRQHAEHRQRADQRHHEQRGGGQGEKPGPPSQPTSHGRGVEMAQNVETRLPSPGRSPQRQPQTWSSTGGDGRDRVGGGHGMGSQEIRSSSSSNSRQGWAPPHQPSALPRPHVAGEKRGPAHHGEPYHGEPRHDDPHRGEPPHDERVYMRSHPGERGRSPPDAPSSWQRSPPQRRAGTIGSSGGGGGNAGDGGREREDPEPLYPVYTKKRKETAYHNDPAASSPASRREAPAAASAEEERSDFRRSAEKSDRSARSHASSPTASTALGSFDDPQAARLRRTHSPCTISWRDGENTAGVSSPRAGRGDAERARHGGRPVDSREKGTAPPSGEQGHLRDEPRGGAPGRYREHYPRHESQFVENGTTAAGGEGSGGGGAGERRDSSHPHASDHGGPRPGPFRLKRPAQLPLHLRMEHHGQAFFPGDNQVPERVSDQQQQLRGSDDCFAPPTRRWGGSSPPPPQRQQQQQPSDGYGRRSGAKSHRESDEGGGWEEEARERQHRAAKMPRLADSYLHGGSGGGGMDVGGDSGRDGSYSGDTPPRGYPKQRQTAQDCHAVVMHHSDWRYDQGHGRDDGTAKAYRVGSKPVAGGSRDDYVAGPPRDHDRPSTLSASSAADTTGRRGDAVLVPSNGGIFVPSGGHVVFHVEAPRSGMRRVSACNGTPIEDKSFTPPQQ